MAASPVWDALLVATAERHGRALVLSEDMQDGAAVRSA